MRFYRPFEEHICLAFQFAIFVDDLKSREQSIGTVVGKGRSIGTAVNKSVLLCKAVIQCVQLFLCLFDFAVRVILGLQFNQIADAISYPNHTLNAVLGGCRYLHRGHTGVLTEIDFVVQNRVREVPYRRVCRDRIIFFLQLIGYFVFGDFSVNV